MNRPFILFRTVMLLRNIFLLTLYSYVFKKVLSLFILLLQLMKRYSAAMVAYRPTFRRWNRSGGSWGRLTFRTKGCSATFCGPTPTKTPPDGARTTVVLALLLALRLEIFFLNNMGFKEDFYGSYTEFYTETTCLFMIFISRILSYSENWPKEV